MKRIFTALLLNSYLALMANSVWADTFLKIQTDEKVIEISSSAFEALEAIEYETTTDWTDGRNHFKGPLIREVIASAGIDPTSLDTIQAKAANDYTVAIPVSDIVKYDVILATEMDGKRLTLRDKGPIWAVYPRDNHAELNEPKFNTRWIWQLVELKLE